MVKNQFELWLHYFIPYHSIKPNTFFKMVLVVLYLQGFEECETFPNFRY